jgi:hypothetical protein
MRRTAQACAAACALLLGAARTASAANFASHCDVSAIRPALPSARFEHCALLRARATPGASGDDTPAVRLLWRVDRSAGSITLGVHIDAPLEALGYFGIGSSWNGGMKGAEMWVAQLADGGAFSLRSFWSDDYVRPTACAAADVSVLGWSSVAGQGTTWAFTRPLSAGADDGGAASVPLLREGGDIMLWALGREPGEFGYHGADARGAKRVLLAGGATPAAVETDARGDVRVVPIVTPPVATDGTVSRYCWSWHKLPSDQRYHITKVAPRLMHPELKSLVHHMVTYACPQDFESGGGGAEADTLRAGGVVCRDEGSMVRAGACTHASRHAASCALSHTHTHMPHSRLHARKIS